MAATMRLLVQYRGPFLHGLAVTGELSLWSILGSLLPGILLAALVMSHSRITQAVGQLLVAIFRNIPSVVQLFMIYYLLPLGLHVKLSPFWSAVAAFVLNGGGYVAEILRSGIEGVPRGQWEAAHSLGIRGARLYTRIVLPQAAILIVGPLMNEVTRQVKSSSLASTIAVQDLMYIASAASSNTFAPTIFFSAGAVLYFILIFPFGLLARGLERRTFRAGVA